MDDIWDLTSETDFVNADLTCFSFSLSLSLFLSLYDNKIMNVS